MKIGTRIQLHPATDQWMQGDRYGTVVGIVKASGYIKVKMDKSQKTYRVNPNDVSEV